MRISLYFILSLFIFQSCSSGEEEKLVTVENNFSLSLPKFLKEVDDLNAAASLQYQSGIKEFYVLVLDESKDEVHAGINENNLAEIYENNIEGYSKLIVENFQQGLAEPDFSETIDTIINGLPAKLTSVKGIVEDIEIFYSLGVYEGEENYFQVLTWTLESRKDKYKSKMKKILCSMKDLKKGEAI